LDLLRELSGALVEHGRRAEIAMAYQPQISVATGEVIALEALLRWTSPRLGVISPERLIEVVEPTALMHTLSGRVVDEVIDQLNAWRSHGLLTRTAINVSVRDLVHDAFVDQVTNTIGRAGVGRGQVAIEITEGALVADEPRISRAVSQLAEADIAV